MHRYRGVFLSQRSVPSSAHSREAARRVRVPAVFAVGAMLALTGCAADRATPTDAAVLVAARDSTAPTPLILRTYDGSGQSVHPDFVAPGPAWGSGLKYLVSTPYPGSSDKHENPSLYASADGLTWDAAPGAPMPLTTPRTGFLSDPDIVYSEPQNDLSVYYRQADGRSDRILLMRSSDGAKWSEPLQLLSGPFATILSPSVVRRGEGDWLMWSVNASGGCHGNSTTVQLRRSANGVTWTAPEPVVLPLPTNRFAWHIDVQWIEARQEYWALFPAKAPGTCATRTLYLATSHDGVTWTTVSQPVLTAGSIPEFQHVVYRSTFAYDAASDSITFWFSGARLSGKKFFWSTAVQRRSRTGVFDAVAPAAVPEGSLKAPAGLLRFDPP